MEASFVYIRQFNLKKKFWFQNGVNYAGLKIQNKNKCFKSLLEKFVIFLSFTSKKKMWFYNFVILQIEPYLLLVYRMNEALLGLKGFKVSGAGILNYYFSTVCLKEQAVC